MCAECGIDCVEVTGRVGFTAIVVTGADFTVTTFFTGFAGRVVLETFVRVVDFGSVFLAVAFFAGVLFFAVAFVAGAAFFTTAFFVTAFFATAFFVGAAFVVAVCFTAVFFTAFFFAVVFFAGAFSVLASFAGPVASSDPARPHPRDHHEVHPRPDPDHLRVAAGVQARPSRPHQSRPPSP